MQGIAPSTELSHSAFNLFAYLGPQAILFGNKSVRSDVSAYALPAYGQRDRLSHVRIYYDIRLFPWWLPIPISIKVNVRPTREYLSPPNTLPYENLPGGNTLLTEASQCANSF